MAKTHFKMYKAGKQWLVAGLTVTTMGVALTFGHAALADVQTKTPNQVSQSSGSVVDDPSASEPAKVSSESSNTVSLVSDSSSVEGASISSTASMSSASSVSVSSSSDLTASSSAPTTTVRSDTPTSVVMQPSEPSVEVATETAPLSDSTSQAQSVAQITIQASEAVSEALNYVDQMNVVVSQANAQADASDNDLVVRNDAIAALDRHTGTEYGAVYDNFTAATKAVKQGDFETAEKLMTSAGQILQTMKNEVELAARMVQDDAKGVDEETYAKAQSAVEQLPAIDGATYNISTYGDLVISAPNYVAYDRALSAIAAAGLTSSFRNIVDPKPTLETDFSNFTLAGSATQTAANTVLLVDGSTPNQMGSVNSVYKVSTMEYDDFTLTGTLTITPGTGSTLGVGDGFAVVLNPNNLDATGTGASNFGTSGVKGSLALVLDPLQYLDSTTHPLNSDTIGNTTPGLNLYGVTTTGSATNDWELLPSSIVHIADSGSTNGSDYGYLESGSYTIPLTVHFDSVNKTLSESLTFNGQTYTYSVDVSNYILDSTGWSTHPYAVNLVAENGSSLGAYSFQLNSFDRYEASTVDVKYITDTGVLLGTGIAEYPDGAYTGNAYQTSAQTFPGYHLDGMGDFWRYPDSGLTFETTTLPANGTLSLDGDYGTVIYVYKADAVAAASTVSYVLVDDSDVDGATLGTLTPAAPVTAPNGSVGDAITVPTAPAIPGYSFVKSWVNGTADTADDTYKETGNTVEYRYVADMQQAVVISSTDPAGTLPTTATAATGQHLANGLTNGSISFGLTDADLTRAGYTYTVNGQPSLAAALATTSTFDDTENPVGSTSDSTPQVFTVVYLADQQTVTVSYVDDDNGGAQVATGQSLTGVTDGAWTYSVSGDTPSVSLANYNIGRVENESGVYAASANPTIIVHLTHKHDVTTETKDVKQTIHYQYADGTPTGDLDNVQKVSFERTVDTDLVEATKSTAYGPVYGAWKVVGNSTYSDVISPVKPGYILEIAGTSDSGDVVPGSTPTEMAGDTLVTVVYHATASENTPNPPFVPAPKPMPEPNPNPTPIPNLEPVPEPGSVTSPGKTPTVEPNVNSKHDNVVAPGKAVVTTSNPSTTAQTGVKGTISDVVLPDTAAEDRQQLLTEIATLLMLLSVTGIVLIKKRQ